jgi:hypothetical protein
MKKMTEERLEWLKANRPPSLIIKKVNSEKINVRESIVTFGNESFNLHHLTKKGYNSKKPLFIDFLNFDRIETFEVKKNGKSFDRKMIVLTIEEFKYLKENFSKTGKVFQTPEQQARVEKMVGMRALAERIDIHDRG